MRNILNFHKTMETEIKIRINNICKRVDSLYDPVHTKSHSYNKSLRQISISIAEMIALLDMTIQNILYNQPPATAEITALLELFQTDIPELKSTTTSESKFWTFFELRRLIRITINDHFFRIQEGTPLQSRFLFPTADIHTTLLRLDSVLTCLAGSDSP